MLWCALTYSAKVPEKILRYTVLTNIKTHYCHNKLIIVKMYCDILSYNLSILKWWVIKDSELCHTLCTATRLQLGFILTPRWECTASVALLKRCSSVTASGWPYTFWNQDPPIITYKIRYFSNKNKKTDCLWWHFVLFSLFPERCAMT